MYSQLSKKIGKGVIVLLITACFIPTMAGAFTSGEGRHEKGFDKKGQHRSSLGIWQNPQIIQNLELTEAQVKELRDADFSYREKRLAIKAELDSLRLQMEKALSHEVVDDKSALQLAEKIADLKGKLFVQRVESRLALGKILSTDQIKKLKMDTIKQKKGARRGKHQISENYSIERPANKSLSNVLSVQRHVAVRYGTPSIDLEQLQYNYS
jgi:Spy/CpxP family protein refolding chaperone